MYYPLRSLQEGHWVKLICGASFQHLPDIRSLALAYTLAGVDCVDVSADPAVVTAVREAFHVAQQLHNQCPQLFPHASRPWLMVSLNDGEDPHFRKAEFDPNRCPADCPRPCEQICPARAIAFDVPNGESGVIEERCYGCGRCLPVCPIQQITTRAYPSDPEAIATLLQAGVEAIEIHTQVGRLHAFQDLWQSLAPIIPQLKLLAISCPQSEGSLDYLRSLYEVMAPLPCPLLWQTDGRPMSGDIGAGTTHAAIAWGQSVLNSDLPGYVQLAGGTNAYTVEKLKSLELWRSPNASTLIPFHAVQSRCFVSGIAYGSYARKLLSPVLQRLENLASPDSSQFSSVRLRQIHDSDSYHQTNHQTNLQSTDRQQRRSPQQLAHTSHLTPHASLFPLPTTPLPPVPLESVPELLQDAVHLARSLVMPMKEFHAYVQSIESSAESVHT